MIDYCMNTVYVLDKEYILPKKNQDSILHGMSMVLHQAN
jgi:hypothetical protein